MATHSNILSWKTPWMEDPGGYVQEKTVYIGFCTIQGFRCPVGVLECIPLWIRGDYCLDNMIKNFIRELETIKKNQMKFYN